MKKDELHDDIQHEAARRRSHERAEQLVDSQQDTNRDRYREIGRSRTVEDDRLLLDEDEAKTELPR